VKRKKPRSSPRTADALLDDGARHYERGELADAEARYRDALALDPDHLGALNLLAHLLVDRGDPEAAIELLDHARALAPNLAPTHLGLGSAYAAAGYDELAIAAMEAAATLDASSTVPLERLARHHITHRRPREAIGLLRRVLRRDPAHEHARFLLAGLSGNEHIATAPAALVAELFDSYAPKFEEHLVAKLAYRVPADLAALVVAAGHLPAAAWTVLDLGCGTGLAGLAFRAHARRLIGSDLSPRMIDHARARGIYDELHVEDLIATLGRAHADVDLIVAADVFIYVGALEAAFAAAAAALHPGGVLAYSTERSPGDDVALLPSLRYAHADAYLARLAGAHGFTVVRAEPSILRVDHGDPIAGTLHVLVRD